MVDLALLMSVILGLQRVVSHHPTMDVGGNKRGIDKTIFARRGVRGTILAQVHGLGSYWMVICPGQACRTELPSEVSCRLTAETKDLFEAERIDRTFTGDVNPINSACAMSRF